MKNNNALNISPIPDEVKVNIVIDKEMKNVTTEEKPFEQTPKSVMNFIFANRKSREINVKNQLVANGDEIIPGQVIQKDENGVFSIIRTTKDTEIDIKLDKDDSRIKTLQTISIN
jgi:hypothetical protein